MEEPDYSDDIDLEALRSSSDHPDWSRVREALWRVTWAAIKSKIPRATDSEVEDLAAMIVGENIIPEMVSPATDSFQNAKSFADIRRLTFTIAGKRAISQIRKNDIRAREENRDRIKEGQERVDGRDEVNRRDDRQNLHEALGDLPDCDREILVDYYFERLSTARIAEKQNKPVGAIYYDLFKARGILREKLEEIGF